MAEMTKDPTTGTLSYDPIAEAMSVAAGVSGGPAIEWTHGDDLCDCTFQRIGWWTNPYLGETLLVRVCCLWERIYAQHPDLVQRVHAYNDPNTGAWRTAPSAWDGEDEMPRHLWHRHLARTLGKPLAAIRELYRGVRPPPGTGRR